MRKKIVVIGTGMDGNATMTAVMKGFLTFRPNNIAGFIFNRLPDSQTDTAKALCSELGTEYLGRFPYCPDILLESRHLGLVTADETAQLREKLHRMGQLAQDNIRIDRLLEIAEFSPLGDKKLPENISGLILGGGYPELYEEMLSENISLRREVREAVTSGLPTIAECGGFILSALANVTKLCPQNHIYQSFCGHFFDVCSSGKYMYLSRRIEGADGKM